jgi:hypothetical protein
VWQLPRQQTVQEAVAAASAGRIVAKEIEVC